MCGQPRRTPRRSSRRSLRLRATSPGRTRTPGRRRRFLPESLGPGCAFLDFDNDGWMDIYLVNSGPCDFFQPAQPLKNALLRNNRDGTFTDVTDKAGVPGGTFGMGVAVGDYNNDGWPDIFVTGYGRSHPLSQQRRWHVHRCDRAKRAWPRPGWTTSAVWFDYDNDGLLDLFVCSFVQYGLDKGLAVRRQERRPPLLPLLHSASLQADAEPPVSQQRRRDLYAGRARHGHRESARQRPSALSPPTSTTTA